MRTITLSEATKLDPKSRLGEEVRVKVPGYYTAGGYRNPSYVATVVADGVTWALDNPIGPAKS